MLAINVVFLLIPLIIIVVVLGITVLSLGSLFLPWRKAQNAKLGVAFLDLVSLKAVHKVSPGVVVNAMISLKESGAMDRDPTINYRSLVEHAIAGGDLEALANEINDNITHNREAKSFQDLAEQQLDTSSDSFSH